MEGEVQEISVRRFSKDQKFLEIKDFSDLDSGAIEKYTIFQDAEHERRKRNFDFYLKCIGKAAGVLMILFIICGYVVSLYFNLPMNQQFVFLGNTAIGALVGFIIGYIFKESD